MALTTRTKILKLFTTKTHCSALALGSRDGFRHDPFRESEYLSSFSFFSSSAANAAVAAETASPSVEVLNGSRLFGFLKEYEDYRRNLYGGLTHKALLVDAVGTLLVPSQPMAQVVRRRGITAMEFSGVD
ncbi:Uncharacterized protein Adt_26906 [Abeliophyllum distichum]|uniref:Uncharacterized protein n=1 Tax=Abeliophyllum distichum TaxID=126358 RepID=A0ABD1RSG5_9LAMI